MYLKQKSGYVQLRLRFHEQEDNKLMLKQLTNALLIWWKVTKCGQLVLEGKFSITGLSFIQTTNLVSNKPVKR